ncbi:unnamed protein product [Pipistrellus nathusii]|uniref:Uncharacterized protein n=1 Tax=Pipistrellus nathusii TaxID=59473 RepID=A0ABP0AB13_PIPNA
MTQQPTLEQVLKLFRMLKICVQFKHPELNLGDHTGMANCAWQLFPNFFQLKPAMTDRQLLHNLFWSYNPITDFLLFYASHICPPFALDPRPHLHLSHTGSTSALPLR